MQLQQLYVGRDGSVGIATRYGVDGPGGRSPVGARFPATAQTGRGVHPASCTMGTGSSREVQRSRHGVDHPPYLVGRFKKEYGSTSNLPWAFVACPTVTCTFTFTFLNQLYNSQEVTTNRVHCCWDQATCSG